MKQIEQLPVSFDLADGHVGVTVRGADAASTVVIRRIGEVEVAKHVPIGTRRREHLEIVIDGETARLRPGPGRWSRGSYKVRVVHGGVTYLLRPKSPDTSRLTRDGVRLGDFELRGGSDGDVRVTWHDDAEVRATDAAVGYAVSAAFGTGAQFMLLALLGMLDDGVPGPG
ncbi:hypothetical protein AB0M36_18825 [Actinoplanes sp. NPDC051346]|uniref:hypothetical protein n=1 Tax=Actinoplanes sp. NPDC051346 TaxID=3155048 RepID=UPI00343FF2ED